MHSIVLFHHRLLEVISYKIYSIQREDALLDMLSSQGSTKSFRIEEIPLDEVNLSHNETLIPVAHFHKVYMYKCLNIQSSSSLSLVNALHMYLGDVIFVVFYLSVPIYILQEVFSTFGVPFLLKIKQVSTVM